MRTFVLTLAAVLALGGVAVAQYGPSPAPAPSPSAAAPAGTSAVPAAAVVVHLTNFAFVPETVTVAPGQSVQFVQDDQTPHTVTATDKSFDSGNLDLHQTWSHAFAKPGTYAYYCTYHPSMKATVVVK